VQKFACHCDIMLIGRRGFHSMDQSCFFINTDMRFVAKVPFIPLFSGMRLRITFFSLFFVDDSDSINVESTIVPFFRINFLSTWISTTSVKIFFYELLFVRMLRNLPIVSPFDTSSGEFIPQNCEKARLSITSFMIAISARLYTFCKMKIRSINSNG
jgi:hypothetical protein